MIIVHLWLNFPVKIEDGKDVEMKDAVTASTSIEKAVPHVKPVTSRISAADLFSAPTKTGRWSGALIWQKK